MLAFAKMLLKMKALIRLESLNTELIAKRSNCRILAESAQSAARLGLYLHVTFLTLHHYITHRPYAQ